MKIASQTQYEEIDISIPNMDTAEAEKTARSILQNRRGIYAVRIIERGVWIEYDPSQISTAHIYELLNAAGLETEVFQESMSGLTGVSSV